MERREFKMNPSQILIVPKISKVQHDMRRMNFDKIQLVEFYKKEKLHVDRIFESHDRQVHALETIKKHLPHVRVVNRNEITKDLVSKYKLVITLGGDNHFQYVSHFIKDSLILGINNDPERSEGALNSITSNEIESVIPKILDDDFKIETWTRLETSVEDITISTLAVSEIYIGEESRYTMSRHQLIHNNDVEEQKGSGLLISTGAGSTGWFDSAIRDLHPNGKVISRDAKEVQFLLTEPHKGKFSIYKMTHGIIKENDVFEIISLNDSDGVLLIDSLEKIKIKEGSKIKIKLGEKLRVVNF